jgi:hypothetical protein
MEKTIKNIKTSHKNRKNKIQKSIIYTPIERAFAE